MSPLLPQGTLKLALNEVKGLRPAEVRTAVSFKTGNYAPDFHAFETEHQIILPWDREIIQDATRRAVELEVEGLVIEFETLPPMTENPAWAIELTRILLDGLETLERVRAQGSQLPVLMLTARDSIDDRVLGLASGADDYLVKPFAVPELLARLHALVRRHELRRSKVLQVAALRFDATTRRAYNGPQALSLTARESIVVEYLLLHIGAIVSRDHLVALIPDWNAATSDNAMELLMSRLRGKIEPAGVRLRTVRGLGYLLEPSTPLDIAR